MEKKNNPKTASHSFNIEVLIEGSTNSLALEKLTQLLQHDSIVEYKIITGIKENDNKQIVELLHHFKENGILVRFSIVKGKGIKLSIPCRVINFDPSEEIVTVYHVDEKKVYSLKLNEIDDFHY